MSVVIRLEWHELILAAFTGLRRHVAAMSQNCFEVYGASPLGSWEPDIIGAIGEMAVAKHLGLFWTASVGRSDKDSGDVSGLQVRATSVPHGCLILYERDADDARFYLAIVNGRDCSIAGSILGRDGKVDRFWKAAAKFPAYFVPAEALEKP